MEIPVSALEYFRSYDNCLELSYQDYDIFEYEGNDPPPKLKGRLKAHLSYWESINANSFVIDNINNGYRIPFKETPSACFLSNNKSAIENAAFVEPAISELVQNHSVMEVPFVPHVVNPLSVSIQSSGKKRLILDLRHVNKCVWKQKIKFEDWGFYFHIYRKTAFFSILILSPATTISIYFQSIKYFSDSPGFFKELLSISVLPFSHLGLAQRHIFSLRHCAHL